MDPSKDDSVFPTAAGSGVANTSFAGQWAKSRTSSSQESGAAFVDAAPEAQANAELGAPPAKIAVTSAAVTVTSDKCDVSIALFQQMQEKIAALERQLCSSMPRNESEVKCFVSAPTAIAAMPSPSQPTAIGVSTQPSVGLNCASAVGNDRAHALPTVCQPQWPTSANSNWISPPMQTNSATASNWTSPRHLLDLPYFDGNAEQWPLFATMYVQSSAMYNYTNFENCLRLQRALKGEARETVKSLLIHPDNVSAVMDQLQCRFGRTEQLIRSQLDQVRQVQPITESGLEKLIPFATKAKNLVVFLESANASHHIANPTLLDELIAKLPMNKRIEWAKYAAPIKPYPTLVDFSQWLDDIANCICAVQQCVSQPHSDSRRRQVLYVNEKKDVCPICGGDHKAPVCQKFAAANVNTRWEECKTLRMCFGCLTPGHSLRNCRRQARCPVTDCYRKHHKLLHAAESRRGASQSCASDRGNAEETVLSCRTPASGNGLLFRVLPVTLYGPKGKKNVYALMDEGSSITIMDNSLIEQLGLPSRQRNLNIQWFGGRSTCEPVQVVNIHVSGASMEKKHMLRNVYGVNDLQLPVQSLHESDLRRISDECPLQPYDNVKPQVLIGLDHCHLGLPTEMITTQKSGPFAAKTELGWVVFGPTLHSVASPSCLLIRPKEDQHLHDLVTDYFSTESFGVKAAPIVESCDDIRARKLLEATTERVGGRFQTGLLWKTDDVLLPDSYPMALKRLIGIERKMKGDVEFAANYSSIISSYVNKGYARKLQPAEAAAVGPTTWYLPHFAVRNPNKPGKLRLVFDAAATVDGISLNTHLLKGPPQYQPLLSVLLNFRFGAVAVCADIREMFHQVMIQPQDRCAQRFLWRHGNETRPPDVYEMMVMTFGAACSPCSAQFVKNRNALLHGSHDDRAVKSIIERHYVDDFVDSFMSTEEATDVSLRVRSIHSAAGFELRNFASNSPVVVRSLGEERVSDKPLSTERVLGMYWQPASDTFRYHLHFHGVDVNVAAGRRCPTKRELLSIVMSIFDPLGFLSQLTVTAKLIMRAVWRHDVGWDEPLPDRINHEWERLRDSLSRVVDVQVPRHYFSAVSPEQKQIHVFVDASEHAFAAVAYWRSTNAKQEVHVSLICAKTRCAPLTPMTIPRLELQAAVLGVRLLQMILQEHFVEVANCFLWSDSKTVIQWISSTSRLYKPFVAHRIAEILSATKESNWRWLHSRDNVADEATRANHRIEMSPKSRWFQGPAFLRQSEGTWKFLPSNSIHDASVASEELRLKTVLLVESNRFIEFNRFSSYTRLERTVAWMLRFCNACRQRLEPLQLYGLSAMELHSAEIVLCRQAQAEAYGAEIAQIQCDGRVSKESTLITLLPYLDDDRFLRVYGRIDAASCLPYSTKRPIILPPNHLLTELIVLHHHSRMMHQNHEAAICEIRRQFWIPRVRQVMRHVVSNCQRCRINKAAPETPRMGVLPKDRLSPYLRPLTNTGLDYFGPVTVTVGRRTEKRWVALFTCLIVRAVHLEIAYDLSTEACILAIRNFINRRGVPAILRSDNGKNFIGANEEAKRFAEVFDCERIQEDLSSRGVQWMFNCPNNPSEGGAWERMVQCVKRVLRHTLKEVSPREHTLHCLIVEAENVVNSRPLTHLPVSVDEEEPLTPNHFLLGSANTAQTPAVTEVHDTPCFVRKQWRIARQLRDRFWKRWIMEYLPTLTRRVKWCQRTAPIQEGDLVYICDADVSRRQWCRGRVVRTYEGVDGIIRRADVRTNSGTLRRPVSKLAVLDVVVNRSDSRGGGC